MMQRPIQDGTSSRQLLASRMLFLALVRISNGLAWAQWNAWVSEVKSIDKAGLGYVMCHGTLDRPDWVYEVTITPKGKLSSGGKETCIESEGKTILPGSTTTKQGTWAQTSGTMEGSHYFDIKMKAWEDEVYPTCSSVGDCGGLFCCWTEGECKGINFKAAAPSTSLASGPVGTKVCPETADEHSYVTISWRFVPVNCKGGTGATGVNDVDVGCADVKPGESCKAKCDTTEYMYNEEMYDCEEKNDYEGNKLRHRTAPLVCTKHPTASPSAPPSRQPSTAPTTAPSRYPTTSPTRVPSGYPSLPPTMEPTNSPIKPGEPSHAPKASPPSVSPTVPPTSYPSMPPTASPSHRPTGAPSVSPTGSPLQPTRAPTNFPTQAPTASPTQRPSATPSGRPSTPPTSGPSQKPSANPSLRPTAAPTASPESAAPSRAPSAPPTTAPSAAPKDPSGGPSVPPSLPPVTTAGPSVTPSVSPSQGPSSDPSRGPSVPPSAAPSLRPSSRPSHGPTRSPSMSPQQGPSASPSAGPSPAPSTRPSEPPSALPRSSSPSSPPSRPPVSVPAEPTRSPTVAPKQSTSATPSGAPSTANSTSPPSAAPLVAPTLGPSQAPSNAPLPPGSPTGAPRLAPTGRATLPPTAAPISPTAVPTLLPTSVDLTDSNVGRDVTSTTGSVVAGAGVLLNSAANVGSAGRLVAASATCERRSGDADMEQKKKSPLPRSVHVTGVKVPGFTLEAHAGCVIVNFAIACAVVGLAAAAGKALQLATGKNIWDATGMIRFPAGPCLAATVLSQGATIAGTAMIKNSEHAGDICIGLAGVLWGLAMPLTILRAGRRSQFQAVYKRDLEGGRQGFWRHFLGPGEWVSLRRARVERWGNSFRELFPRKFWVVALDIFLSLLASISTGVAGGSCVSCGMTRVFHAALALPFVFVLVRDQPYTRPPRCPLTVVAQLLLGAASIALAYGYFDPGCDNGDDPLPGHQVAWPLLAAGGAVSLLTAIVAGVAALRSTMIQRRATLHAQITNAFGSPGKDGYEARSAGELKSGLEKMWGRHIPQDEFDRIYRSFNKSGKEDMELAEFLNHEHLFWSVSKPSASAGGPAEHLLPAERMLLRCPTPAPSAVLTPPASSFVSSGSSRREPRSSGSRRRRKAPGDLQLPSSRHQQQQAQLLVSPTRGAPKRTTFRKCRGEPHVTSGDVDALFALDSGSPTTTECDTLRIFDPLAITVASLAPPDREVVVTVTPTGSPTVSAAALGAIDATLGGGAHSRRRGLRAEGSLAGSAFGSTGRHSSRDARRFSADVQRLPLVTLPIAEVPALSRTHSPADSDTRRTRRSPRQRRRSLEGERREGRPARNK
eukprot:TRINITY_DN29365_c0_g1_i4.p1 TRINITY_DN29365_c0_g1~~TRINITY_DN29365_c0_g1_i4.p1  ORF type:complete len:1344 (+),score=98.81 TRINITY_DN29365_c0_g1_i4:85-4116(+)